MDGVALHIGPQAFTQGLLGHQVDWPVQQVFQVELDAKVATGRCRPVEAHQHINITTGVCGVARHAAEQPHVLHAEALAQHRQVFAQQGQDVVAVHGVRMMPHGRAAVRHFDRGRKAQLPNATATRAATVIQTRHRIPEAPLHDGQILVYQVPIPEPLRFLEPRETETRALHALEEYGLELGIAFQIVDDLLDVEGDAAEIGKTPGKDAAAGKATFVSILGVERARAQAGLLARQAAAHLEPFGGSADLLKQAANFVVARRT